MKENLTDTMLPRELAEAASKKIEDIIKNVDNVILGKHEVVSLVVMALIAEGHVLLEDVPGVGKTSLVYAIAKSTDCAFKRIQFTRI